MKKLSLLMMSLCTVWLLQSCGGGAKSSTETADSANTAKMDSSKGGDSTAKTPAVTVNADDSKFAVDAANGGMAEVALSKLAQTKATNAKVKDFAAMMIADHTKANDEMMALAKSKNITLPATVSSDKQKTADDLGKKTGADFDKNYVDIMVDDHQKTVDMFQDESKKAKDPDIKAFVDKTLPTLKTHLENIKAIKAGMK